MSKEKQIEEIAKILKEAKYSACEDISGAPKDVDDLCIRPTLKCEFCKQARALIEAGYRKQKWISVEDRLPTREEADIGLIAVVNGIGEDVNDSEVQFEDAFVLSQYDFDRKKWWSEIYGIEHCKVEYWMPIPLPPKEKGGVQE